MEELDGTLQDRLATGDRTPVSGQCMRYGKLVNGEWGHYCADCAEDANATHFDTCDAFTCDGCAKEVACE